MPNVKSDADRQEEYDKAKQKEVDAYERDPEKATARGNEEAMDRLRERNAGLMEDINSMVHPEGDDPVETRGSGKDGVPAGTEEMLKANKRNQPGGKATGPDGQIKEGRERTRRTTAEREREEERDQITSDRSTSAADKNAAVTVDPADGSKRTKDGVK